MKREQSQINWKILSLILSALLIVSWVFFAIAYSTDFLYRSVLTEYTDVAGKPIDGNGDVMDGDICAMPSAMAFRSAQSLDGEEAYDSVVLNATVSPDTATDKSLDWSVEFADPASEWANGKNVTDYVTVTPQSDGSSTATVQCLQPFGEQIIITAASRQTPAANAVCVADFYARSIGVELEFHTDNMGFTTFSSSNLSPVLSPEFRFIWENQPSYLYSDHTLVDNFTHSSNAYGTEEMLAVLHESGVSSARINENAYSESGLVFVGREILEGFDSEDYGDCPPYYEIAEDELTEAFRIVYNNPDIPLCRFEFTAQGEYSSATFVWNINGSRDSFYVPVQNVTFDKSEIKF